MTDDGAGDDRGAGADPHLELRGLCKEYPGEVTAVEDLTLSLAEGELLVFVGPSGCGKSTTLRCIAGLEEPTAGDVRIAGRSVVGRRPEARDIAMVFQNYALYPHKTARENIGFGLRMTTDLPSGEIDDRVESVAETLGIVDLLDQKPKALSGGQQQRVALGRAIIRDPSVFLLDEPLSNLDATLRARMRTEIQQLQRDLGVTTVYVTHDQVEAMTMGDRIAVLQDGRLEQAGTPMELYRRPASRFVAGFIGEPSMNFLTGEFDPSGPSLVGPVESPLTPELRDAARRADGSALTVGLRPEAVGVEARPGSEAEPPSSHSFPGHIDVVEPVGEQSFLYVTLDAGPTVTAAVPGAGDAREGDPVWASLPPERVHLFDARTGRALHHPDPGAVETTLAPEDGSEPVP
ncbi:MAG: ATP-binding cassette domain-containing protein [Haloarculaceae archaeon]